jgi:Ca-activated chloride channel family protein
MHKETLIMKKTKIIIITGIILISLFAALSAASDEFSDKASSKTSNDKTLSPYFFIENGDPTMDPFPLKSTNAQVNINGLIADVVITQQYQNNGTRPINARYIFPASTRAAVHGMKMQINDEIIEAKIQERQTAEKKFEAAKKSGKIASMLKQNRPNVFSMNVANIMPGDTIDIELKYTELLTPTDGTYEFVYPAVVGPRYSSHPEIGAPETDQWVKNPYLKQGAPNPASFNITCNLSTGIDLAEVSCKSHDTNIAWENKSSARVLLENPEDFSGDRDYILNYRLSGKQIDSGLLLYEGEEDEENFFLLTVQPPDRIRSKDIPPREYIFVVDISGSMNGFPLNTSKKLLKNLISGLKQTDKFNIILFSGGSSIMSPTSLPATTANIYSAIRHIENQRGGGGTELHAALEKSYNIPTDETFSRSVIIVTDGYISAERDVFSLIENNLNHANLFSFGIGSSVNRYLIEGMAKAGMGEPFVVTDPKKADAVAEKFRQYISSPVLTNINATFDEFDTYDVEPKSIPDLFAQRPVVIFGKWRGRPKGGISLSGMGGQEAFVKKISIADSDISDKNSALKYLWARTRIARLSDFNVNRNNPDTRGEITSLGLTYNLLTDYTSFLAIHDVIRNPEANAHDVNQPLPLPKHVSSLAVGGFCSPVPEPELYWLLACFLILAVGRKIFQNKLAAGKGA